jgi:hypothetical protein
VLNFAHEPETYSLPGEAGRVLLTTFLDRQGERIEAQVRLRAEEGVVIELDVPSESRAA